MLNLMLRGTSYMLKILEQRWFGILSVSTFAVAVVLFIVKLLRW